jgi:hypothetical protein
LPRFFSSIYALTQNSSVFAISKILSPAFVIAPISLNLVRITPSTGAFITESFKSIFSFSA